MHDTLPSVLEDRKDADAPVNNPTRISIVSTYVDLAAKLGTLLFLGLAFLQYSDSGADRKRERTLALVDEWIDQTHASRYSNVSNHLRDTWIEVQPEVDKLPEGARARARDNAEDRIFRALAKPKGLEEKRLREDIDTLFQFFARVHVCVSSGLCDKEIAMSYFSVEARSMVKELDPFLTLVRDSGLESYGKGAAHLAR